MADNAIKDVKNAIDEITGTFADTGKSTYYRIMKALACRQLKVAPKVMVKPAAIEVVKQEHYMANYGDKLQDESRRISNNIQRPVSDSSLNVAVLNSSKTHKENYKEFTPRLDDVKTKTYDLQDRVKMTSIELEEKKNNVHSQYEELGKQIEKNQKNQADAKLNVWGKGLADINKKITTIKKDVDNTSHTARNLKVQTDIVISNSNLQQAVAEQARKEAPEPQKP